LTSPYSTIGIQPSAILQATFGNRILVPLARNSSSSFLPLSVAFLAAAASLQSGGAWLGDRPQSIGDETHDAVASLKEDAREVQRQAERTPAELRNFWNDVSRDLRTLAGDLAADARSAAGRISNLLKNS
jgi:hypothetical protein